MAERVRAWRDLKTEFAAAGVPLPEILRYRRPLEIRRSERERLSAGDLERRYLENVLLLQEAEWFMRELSISQADVPHFICLLDREGWCLRIVGEPKLVKQLNSAGVTTGIRATSASGLAPLLEVPVCGGRPAVALFPARPGELAAGWTVITLPLRPSHQTNAGVLLVACADRRSSRRLYAQVCSAASAIERQMLWCDRLAQADRLSLVGTMISQIVHEVKNPLAAMKAALQLAQASEGEERNECIKLVNKEIEELNALVENLLGLAKPAPAEFALQCLDVILEEVLGLIRYEAALRGIRIVYSPTRNASFLRCDGRLLKQAFLNLARNAVQAMPQGGLLTIVFHRNSRKGGLSIEVSDTGVGIPPENAAHLFEPFFTTKGTAGTGLGLSVTRRIIEEVHLGHVTVESVLGQGTRFHVFLPFNPETSAAQPAAT